MSARIDAVAICGPTAAGKTEMAAMVAESIDGEVVNADSRQIYRGMRIGTGMPDDRTLARVPHHLFAFADPCERYSAGAYVADATALCSAIRRRGKVPIVVGGTGFYIDALRGAMRLDRPFGDDGVRARIKAEAAVHPHEALRAWLAAIAPAAAEHVLPGDRYRTLRALEAALAQRDVAPHRSTAARGEATTVRLAMFVVTVDAGELARRIHARVRAMFDAGIVEEALAVARRCAAAPALTGIGYGEALALYRGECTRDEAIRFAVARTIRYAKRQRTWFRRMKDAVMVDGASVRDAAELVASSARETAVGP